MRRHVPPEHAKLMIGYPEFFPAPVHEGSTTLWHLLDVLVWLDQRDYSIDPMLLDVADGHAS